MIRRVFVRAGAGVLAMGLGTTVVLQTVILMNDTETKAPEKTEARAMNFATPPKPPPPKPKPRPKPRPKKAKRVRRAAAPPPAFAGGGLGMPGFSMPGFDVGADAGATQALLGSVKAGVMAAGAVDEKARPTRRVGCKIPGRVLARREPGVVKFSVLVNSSGSIVRSRLVESKPPGMYDAFCRDAAKQWEFKPAMYKGQPVETWVTIPFKIAAS